MTCQYIKNHPAQELASTNIVDVRFSNIPGPFADAPGAYAIADDGGEWRLSEKEIAEALNRPAQPVTVRGAAMSSLCKAAEAVDQHINAIHAAFGAPGDYGYESPQGAALYELYKSQVELRAAIRQALIDEARAIEVQP